MEIKIYHVYKNIKKSAILKDIHCSFESGKVYGLQGHNGSGKTMLIRLIGGFIYPDMGNVSIDQKILGKDIYFPESMGILIENPAFLDTYDGLTNLKMIASLNSKINEQEIIEILDKVGLKENMRKKYKKYSLGMKQRLGIAAAIMEKPDLVLLDEPTNALDNDGIQMLCEIIRELKCQNCLVIIASHDKEFLTTVSDVIYSLSNGEIVSMQENELKGV